ncbi:hypothetical protein [Staphylococcus equorum]|uniref:hypothetical protein n=1 Tax=Staphylococcus equorum TaxID=246432 RepID=UPI000853E56D|nr:hypothetical protein [Staphylococcus equorum]OEK60616.1 hypothetical protein ASS99_11175 [Staphylococcus equorum]
MNKQAVNPLKEVNTYFTLEFYVRSYVAQIKKNIHRLPNVWQEVINNNSHLNNIDLAYAILREIDIRERL